MEIDCNGYLLRTGSMFHPFNMIWTPGAKKPEVVEGFKDHVKDEVANRFADVVAASLGYSPRRRVKRANYQGGSWAFDANVFVDGHLRPAEAADRLDKLAEVAGTLGIEIRLLSNPEFDVPPA